MSNKVYFAPARAKRWDYSASQVAGLERLIEKLDFGSAIAEGEYVAIKTHFGSQGAHRVVRPRFLRILAEALGVDGQLHVDAAAQIGLGNREYELIEV